MCGTIVLLLEITLVVLLVISRLFLIGCFLRGWGRCLSRFVLLGSRLHGPVLAWPQILALRIIGCRLSYRFLCGISLFDF